MGNHWPGSWWIWTWSCHYCASAHSVSRVQIQDSSSGGKPGVLIPWCTYSCHVLEYRWWWRWWWWKWCWVVPMGGVWAGPWAVSAQLMQTMVYNNIFPVHSQFTSWTWNAVCRVWTWCFSRWIYPLQDGPGCGSIHLHQYNHVSPKTSRSSKHTACWDFFPQGRSSWQQNRILTVSWMCFPGNGWFKKCHRL